MTAPATKADPRNGATVTDDTLMTLTKTPPQSLILTWTDAYGTGTRRFDDPDIRRGAVELAAPADTAELTLESEDDEITVCRFAP